MEAMILPPAPPIGHNPRPVPEPPLAETLSRIPWLRHVRTATIEHLARQAVLHRVPAGSILFEQSEIPTFAPWLLRGAVELVGVEGDNEVVIETVQPFDPLLPAAVLNRQPFLTRARALEPSHLALIQADTFRDAVASDHALCLAILACEAAQFRRQVKQAKNLKLRPAEDRVGCYLLSLVERHPEATTIRLPIEKRRIAGQLGMTRETLSRTLAAMAKHGLRIAGDTVTVTDAATLRARFHLDPLIDAPEPIDPIAPLAP
ncbi:MAG: helix-turn-helix domain-containing protein [Rhodospirillales bacterium]|nr:helix-turn-helix domain-containing protein [Rhodospirillales bacterium]